MYSYHSAVGPGKRFSVWNPLLYTYVFVHVLIRQPISSRQEYAKVGYTKPSEGRLGRKR